MLRYTALGALRIIGRIVYFTGYSKVVEKRSPGFAIQALDRHSPASCCGLVGSGPPHGV